MNNHKPIYKIMVSAYTKIRRIGLCYTAKVLAIYFFMPIAIRISNYILHIYMKCRRRLVKVFAFYSLRRIESNKSNYISHGKIDSTITISELGLCDTDVENIRQALDIYGEVSLAKIDQDGFYLSEFGRIPELPCVGESDFLPRRRFFLELVAIEGIIGVKKHYGGNALSFLREIKALHKLSRVGCNVPAILDIDFEKMSLTMSLIPGRVLREQLAERGAVLRDRDVCDNRAFNMLSKKERWLARIEEGRKHLYNVVDNEFIDNLFDQIRKIHSTGILINDIKYGNIIVEKGTGSPFLVDFEGSEYIHRMPWHCFRMLIDRDVELFNQHFGTSLPTYRTLDRTINNMEYPHPQKWYAPAYFGFGLRIGSLFNTGVGWGRWCYLLKENLPTLRGRRILDLGSNNGFIPLQMLRSGAKEVIGFENNPEAIDQGLFLKSVAEWSDNRSYDFRYVQSNMISKISMDLGAFDMVTALCSIYYLDDEDINQLMTHVSTITDVFIIQGNTSKGIGRGDPHTYEKASVEYLRDALELSGFPQVTVICPKNYSRPLLIGRKTCRR